MPNAVLAAKTAETAATNGGAITLRNYEEYTTQQWYFYNESGTAPVDPSINGSLTYTVNYNASGANNVHSSQSKVHGTNLTLSYTIPSKIGYAFKGWDTSSTATTVVYQPGATYSTNANVTLYAVWEANKYSVTYNANGGTNAPDSQTKEYDEELTLTSTVPTKTGYTFIGWALNANATTALYQSGDIYTNNESVILYAVWTQNVVEDNTDGDKPSDGDKPVVDKETVVDETTVKDETAKPTDSDNVDNNDNNDNNDNDEKKSGCNSSAALSGLAIVGVIGAAFACKKKKRRLILLVNTLNCVL